jgi:lipopolysaccharide assembly protein A
MHAFIIIILILAILLVIFTLQNSFEITITAFFWEIPDAPLVLVLLICVFLGYIISAIYFYPRLWMIKKERKQLTKINNQLNKELEKKKQQSPSEKTDAEGIELDVDDNEDNEHGFFRE